jgi:hypothetical protein
MWARRCGLGVDADGKISDAMGKMRDYMTTEVPFKQKTWRMGFRLDENTLVGLRRRKQKRGRHSPDRMHDRNLTPTETLAQQE